MPQYEIAAMFRMARGTLSLRDVASRTKINHETWRSIEIERILEPGAEFLRGAASLPGAPSYEEFVVALKRDHQRRFEEAYQNNSPPKEDGQRPAATRGRKRGKATASTS